MLERIQRKRSKGWRMPENTVYVGRPTRWGNPWRAGIMGMSASEAVEAFAGQMALTRLDDPEYFRRWLEPLRGKNLACWCPPGQPCHADVLLRLANAQPDKEKYVYL